MILITGGTGYIGSHTATQLLQAGYPVLILDNLCNSHLAVLDRLQEITGQKPAFIREDLRNLSGIQKVFADYPINAVIHFAGLKAVGESVAQPLHYYENNVYGTLNLLQSMQTAGVKTLIFSSSATVYGAAQQIPITEETPCAPTNPYGRSKWMIENILNDLAHSDPEWRIACLRYFNPVGAHPSGLIGEFPQGTPNNLMPYLNQVAIGQRPSLQIYGKDYPTPDGTGIRDYIHVEDLAAGHLAALTTLQNNDPQSITVNLGSGRGYSVLELVHTFSQVNQVPIPYEFTHRRPGDIAVSYTDPQKALRVLGWQTQRSLIEICQDSWRWQRQNPIGYAT